jgi:hypothetical protein
MMNVMTSKLTVIGGEKTLGENYKSVEDMKVGWGV